MRERDEDVERGKECVRGGCFKREDEGNRVGEGVGRVYEREGKAYEGVLLVGK